MCYFNPEKLEECTSFRKFNIFCREKWIKQINSNFDFHLIKITILKISFHFYIEIYNHMYLHVGSLKIRMIWTSLIFLESDPKAREGEEIGIEKNLD